MAYAWKTCPGKCGVAGQAVRARRWRRRQRRRTSDIVTDKLRGGELHRMLLTYPTLTGITLAIVGAGECSECQQPQRRAEEECAARHSFNINLWWSARRERKAFCRCRVISGSERMMLGVIEYRLKGVRYPSCRKRKDRSDQGSNPGLPHDMRHARRSPTELPSWFDSNASLSMSPARFHALLWPHAARLTTYKERIWRLA